MGNCVSSVHKSTNSSAMKLGLQIDQSPFKEKTPTTIQDKFGFKPQSLSPTSQQVANFPDLSYEEELYFDSYANLESDCEDYFSLNGDTPSRGNTPIHPDSIIESPQPEKTIYIDNVTNCISESSPADMKKLFELFNESFNSSEAKVKSIGFDIPPNESVPNSSCSAGATPSRGWYSKKEKSGQSAHCCLPSFVRSMSFSERKKRLGSNNMHDY